MSSSLAWSLSSTRRCVFFFQAEDGIRDLTVTGVQTCALPIAFVAHESVHVGPRQRVAPTHAREVDGGLGDRHGALDGREWAVERQRIAAQRHPHAEPLREGDQIAVVHARERERIHAFGREPMDDLVAHGLTSMWSAARSAGLAGPGAPSNRARAVVVFGKAITSRRLAAPASSMTTRSKPTANPPCGGAPACSPLNKNPNRASASSGDMPRCPKTRRCTAGSVIRIDPEPSSLPL